VSAITSSQPSAADRLGGLDPETLIRAFVSCICPGGSTIGRSLSNGRNRTFFQISGAGHEAVQVAAALRYIRAGLGLSVLSRPGFMPGAWRHGREMLLAAVGAAADPASGGRQMPSHWGSPKLHIVSSSSQPHAIPFSAGCAEAVALPGQNSNDITLVTSGEGATSEGEFWKLSTRPACNACRCFF